MIKWTLVAKILIPWQVVQIEQILKTQQSSVPRKKHYKRQEHFLKQ